MKKKVQPPFIPPTRRRPLVQPSLALYSINNVVQCCCRKSKEKRGRGGCVAEGGAREGEEAKPTALALHPCRRTRRPPAPAWRSRCTMTIPRVVGEAIESKECVLRRKGGGGGVSGGLVRARVGWGGEEGLTWRVGGGWEVWKSMCVVKTGGEWRVFIQWRGGGERAAASRTERHKTASPPLAVAPASVGSGTFPHLLCESGPLLCWLLYTCVWVPPAAAWCLRPAPPLCRGPPHPNDAHALGHRACGWPRLFCFFKSTYLPML